MKYFIFVFIFFSTNVFSEFVIVTNKHEKKSREFVSNYSSGYKVIDFYDSENNDTKEFLKLGINISDFPSVVDTELKIVIGRPTNLANAFSEIKGTEKYKVDKVLKDMKFGQSIIAFIRSKNIDNNVPIATRDAMEASFTLIMKRLDAGQLSEARDLIDGVVVDGVILTEEFKLSIIGKLNNYLQE